VTRRLTPYLLLAVLLLGTGPGIAAGLAGSPAAAAPSSPSLQAVLTAGQVSVDPSSFQLGPLIQFASTRSGWVVDPVQPDRILRTVDGGRTWITSFAGSKRLEIDKVQFVNELDGWALQSGGELIVTRDGGRSWSVSTSQPLIAFDFTDTRDGWAVTDLGDLLTSDNGGVSWTEQSAPVAVTVCATQTGAVWLGGINGNVYLSQDGGAWSSSLLSSAVPDIHNSVGPNPQVLAPFLTCTDSAAWALYTYGAAAGSTPYALEATVDNGQRWSAVLSAEVQPAATETPRGAGGTLVGLVSQGSASAWFLTDCGPCSSGDPTLTVTNDGTIFKSTPLPLPRDTYGLPTAMAFLNAHDGWVVLRETPERSAGSLSAASDVVLTTRDGGLRWRVIDRTPVGDILYGP
jgi:photosystem II stability/assembly factor-like uncharacterized protein